MPNEQDMTGLWRGTYGRLIQERMAASFAPLPHLTRSAERACQHAHLGKPETAHGPTLEYRQLPHGSSSHSQQWVWSQTHIVPHPQHHLQRPHHVHIGSTRTCSSSTPLGRVVPKKDHLKHGISDIFYATPSLLSAQTGIDRCARLNGCRNRLTSTPACARAPPRMQPS
jgi:hypothetical protein